MNSSGDALKVPDIWQQSALRQLREGRDVVVAAPTGAGKTFVFEMFIGSGFRGQAIYTVPTRALANDKRLEWRQQGWEVGICTGDRSENLSARVVVATMETQKQRLLQGNGPDLLVVDEYQMLGDEHRGINYEWALAGAPRRTQLLLFSGSVGNPGQVVQWLHRLGRDAVLVRHEQRPVPLEEVHSESLPDNLPASVQGLWPCTIARAMRAGMAPLLAFAPRRKAAEDLAMDLARMLPEEDPLLLTPEQKALAGEPLRRLLKCRVAFHHSGLSYAQRAGLVEPLAKAGQLKVVVATMGLAAGINFSMRSVLVTDRSYRVAESTHEVRPDELLQMFGRAGRRGMDKVGYIIAVPSKPRLSEARPIRLRRTQQVDWPSLIRVMQAAIIKGENPTTEARNMTLRLFSDQRIPLGLGELKQRAAVFSSTIRKRIFQEVEEFQTPDGDWQRLRAPRKVELGVALLFQADDWQPALSRPESLQALAFGSLCKITVDGQKRFGRELALARFGRDKQEGELVLNRSLLRLLRASKATLHEHWPRLRWTLDSLEKRVLPLLPKIAYGGRFLQWREHRDQLSVVLDFSTAKTLAQIDSQGRGLINPPLRKTTHEVALGHEHDSHGSSASTVADAWLQLGLIDCHGFPTTRGILFSFFNYGEGLAIAAALEDKSYALEDLILDLANLRAGHRFSCIDNSSSRLAAACRNAYGLASYRGYLLRGVPPNYGEGAAELMFSSRKLVHLHHRDTDLRAGDVQRAELEWRSLVRHIAAAPDLNLARWMDLREQIGRAHV